MSQEKPTPAADPNKPTGHNDNDPADESPPDLPELDEGPPAEPVDEIQAALYEAARQGLSPDIEFEKLTSALDGLKPSAQVDDMSADEVAAALQNASQEGLSPDVDFDTLPAPSLTPAPAEPPKPPDADDDAESTALPEPEPSPEEKDTKEAEATPPPAEKTITKKQPAPRPPDPLPVVSDFWLIFALFAGFRLFTLLLLKPGGFIRDWSDFDTFFGIAALSDYGLYPFTDFWLEWPPLIPWLTVGAYQLTLNLPPWPDDPRLWFVLLLGGVFVLFEIGNFVLVYRLARQLFRAPATVSRVLWLYALLFPPVYAMLGFFDGVALFFILLSLHWLLADRRSLSALAVGVGIMVKIIPGLMLPVAARKLWHQFRSTGREAAIEIGLYTVITGLTVLALLIPFLMWGPQWLLASIRSMMGRASWETPWAIIEGYYGFGAVLGDRFNPAETNFAIHEGWLPWWLISLVFAGLYLLIFSRPADYDQPRSVVAFGGLTTLFLLLYSKGYSPQFLIYLLPFIILLLPNGRGVTYALLLTGLNVLEQPIYFVLLPNESYLLLVAVLGRLLVHLTLLLEFALILWPVSRPSPLTTLRRAAPAALGILAAVTLVVLTPISLQAYNASQVNNTPLGTLTGFLTAQANQFAGPRQLLLSEQETYRQLYPYLNEQFELHLTDGDSKGFAGAPAPAQRLAGLNRVWILPTGPNQQALLTAVSGRGNELAAYQFDELGRLALYSFEQNPLPRLAMARFSGGIELLTYQLDVSDNFLDVTLYWRAQIPLTQNLTAFTQLLNDRGELIAGHDGIPGGTPVTSWPIDVVQADYHRIRLPVDLAPGDYTVVVGLYNDFDDRVRGMDPGGGDFANQAVPLEALRFE